LFIQYIADYIYANPNPDSLRQTIRGTFPVFTFQQDPALFYGFDAAVKLDLIPNRLAYNFQFSIVHAKNTALDSYLPYIPSDRMSHSVQWNIANTRLLQNNFLKISHQFVARQKRYEASTDYVAPPPEYHLLALYAGSTLPMKHQKLSIQVAIENLTNTLYKDYMDRFRYYAHQQGRNFSLRLSYNF